jgi:hypothetical protein
MTRMLLLIRLAVVAWSSPACSPVDTTETPSDPWELARDVGLEVSLPDATGDLSAEDPIAPETRPDDASSDMPAFDGAQDGACTTNCSGRECGPDGCGGQCGGCGPSEKCEENGKCTSAGGCETRACGTDPAGIDCGSCPGGALCGPFNVCLPCTPECDSRECGPDGCNGTCGECVVGAGCQDGKCRLECLPSCAEKECGADGCGSTCGICDGGATCFHGRCCPCAPADCTGVQCGISLVQADASCGGCGQGELCDGAGKCVTMIAEPSAWASYLVCVSSCDPMHGYLECQLACGQALPPEQWAAMDEIQACVAIECGSCATAKPADAIPCFRACLFDTCRTAWMGYLPSSGFLGCGAALNCQGSCNGQDLECVDTCVQATLPEERPVFLDWLGCYFGSCPAEDGFYGLECFAAVAFGVCWEQHQECLDL